MATAAFLAGLATFSAGGQQISTAGNAAQAQATALGDLAAQMQPGEWRELATIGFDGGAILLPNFAGDGSSPIIEFTDEAQRNPLTKKIYILGCARGSPGGSGLAYNCGSTGAEDAGFIEYDETSNSWRRMPTAPVCAAPHAYDHAALNPATGEYFFLESNQVQSRDFWKLSGGQWTTLPYPSGTLSGFGGLEFFPELGAFVFVDGGAGFPPAVFTLPSGATAWTKTDLGHPIGKDHNFSEYSAKHKLLFLGGGAGGDRVLLKMDATGRITRAADAPIPLGVYGSGGRQTTDPVTGNLLALETGGNVYEYDPTVDRWTRQGPHPLTGVYGSVIAVLTPVPEHGVVFAVKWNAGSGTVYLYKHSAGGAPPPPTPPPAPGGLTATAVSSSQIDLSWTDASTNETGFEIDRATSATGPWTQIATVGPNVTTYSDTGLAASTTYSYRVRATNAAGDSANSNVASATTQDPPNVAPAAPSELTATAVSSGQIDLSWTDASTNETGFEIDRATSATGPWTQIATVGPNVTTYSNTGLAASTTYSYRVRATNSAGDSPNSNVAGATTPSGLPPSGVLNVNFQPAGAPVPAGYQEDSGLAFGDRGNGLRYGWSSDKTAGARDRDSAASPDQRYDTLLHMGGGTWEAELPNGSYRVRVVAGDPAYGDVVSRTLVEGAVAIDGQTSAGQLWLEGTVDVTVADGRLTVSDVSGGATNKICFVDISAGGAPPPPPPEDSDGDGLPDAWETQHFGDTTSQDGAGDPDGDGSANLAEYQAGTDPTSASSVPGGAGGSGGNGGGGGGCGALGIESLLVAALHAGLRRVRPGRR
jgi:hypothetical protein